MMIRYWAEKILSTFFLIWDGVWVTEKPHRLVFQKKPARILHQSLLESPRIFRNLAPTSCWPPCVTWNDIVKLWKFSVKIAEGGETSLTKIFEICGNVWKFCFTIHCHTIKTVFPFYEFQSASFNISLLEAVTRRLCLEKKLFWKFLQNYLGKHLRQSIFSKKRPATSLSKTPTPVFSCKFYQILQGSLKNTWKVVSGCFYFRQAFGESWLKTNFVLSFCVIYINSFMTEVPICRNR